MLSAVAARKAALAARQPQQQEPPTPSQSVETPAPLYPFETLQNAKRKSSSQAVKKEKKRHRKIKSGERRAEKMAVDSFKEQEDMIVIDGSEDDSEDDVTPLEASQLQIQPVTPNSRLKRQPLSYVLAEDQSYGSSDDEEQQEGEIADLSSVLVATDGKQREVDADESAILSTFKLVEGQNIFFLTSEERELLHVQPQSVALALTPQDTVCLLGACSLRVLRGHITVFGTTLVESATNHHIYAPSSSPLPILRPVARSHPDKSQIKLPTRLTNLEPLYTVVLLQEFKTGIEILTRICRPFDGVFEPKRLGRPSKSPFGIEGLHLVIEQTRNVHPYILPASWSKPLSALVPDSERSLPPVCLVKGPKKSGKSTFARTLTNRLLEHYQHVAFIECDIGQSEFTPGGMVSLNVISTPLLGPPFTHPTLPNRAHFVGDTTPRSSPTQYLDSIFALIQAYRLDIQTFSDPIDVDLEDDDRITDVIPLVVNAMGWSKGLGSDLTYKIEDYLAPTDVFELQAPIEEQYQTFIPPLPISTQYSGFGAYSSGGNADEGSAKVHLLQPIQTHPSLSGYAAPDIRAIATLSYFYAHFPCDPVPGDFNQVTATSWDASLPLFAVPPYDVDCSVAFDRVILVGAGSEDVVKEEIPRVLNGSVVAFVSCQPGTLDSESQAGSSGIPYIQHQSSPSATTSNCVGLGLIRGVSSCNVDPSTSVDAMMDDSTAQVSTHLHILTPLPSTLLVNARVLVKGELELPMWCMLDFRNLNSGDENYGDVGDVERDQVPFLQWGKAPEGAFGAQKRKIRRNLMRKGHL